MNNEPFIAMVNKGKTQEAVSILNAIDTREGLEAVLAELKSNTSNGTSAEVNFLVSHTQQRLELYSEAFRSALQAAEAGFPAGYYRAGCIVEDFAERLAEDGTEHERARHYFELASDQNHIWSRIALLSDYSADGYQNFRLLALRFFIAPLTIILGSFINNYRLRSIY